MQHIEGFDDPPKFLKRSGEARWLIVRLKCPDQATCLNQAQFQ